MARAVITTATTATARTRPDSGVAGQARGANIKTAPSSVFQRLKIRPNQPGVTVVVVSLALPPAMATAGTATSSGA
jgi:hypothetical protein